MNAATAKHVTVLEGRTDNAFPRWFVLSAGAILAITGVAKAWSAFGGTKLLAVVDPILGIQFRHLMLAVGVAELAIAVVCLFSKANKLATMLVAWMATNFLVYRLGLWWMDWHRSCGCLGNLMDALHISPQMAENLVKVLLAYLLIGSYALMLYQWRKGRREALEAKYEKATVLQEPTVTE